MPNLSTLFLDGMTPENLAERILGTDCKILDKENVSFACDCSKEKYSKILATLKPEQLKKMIEKIMVLNLFVVFVKKSITLLKMN